MLWKRYFSFTKQYTDLIAKEINCEATHFEKVDTIEISDYGIIIYGGRIYADRILG